MSLDDAFLLVAEAWTWQHACIILPWPIGFSWVGGKSSSASWTKAHRSDPDTVAECDRLRNFDINTFTDSMHTFVGRSYPWLQGYMIQESSSVSEASWSSRVARHDWHGSIWPGGLVESSWNGGVLTAWAVKNCCVTAAVLRWFCRRLMIQTRGIELTLLLGYTRRNFCCARNEDSRCHSPQH
jgi:hypothetical protein